MSGDPCQTSQKNEERISLQELEDGRAENTDSKPESQEIANYAKEIAKEKKIPDDSKIKKWDTDSKAKLLAYFLSYCIQDGKDKINDEDEEKIASDQDTLIFHSALDISFVDQQKECFSYLWKKWKKSDCEDPERTLSNIFTALESLHNFLKADDLSSFENRLSKIDFLGESIKQNLLIEDFTFLQYACSYGKLNIAKHLIRSGFPVNPAPVNPQKPIHLASKNGNPEILKLIIQNSTEINVNDQDKFGRTPLHYAVMCKNESCILILLRNGASLDVKDNFGQTPLSSMPKSALEEYLDSMISFNDNKSGFIDNDNESYDLQFDFQGMFQKEEGNKYSFTMDLLKKIKRERPLRDLIGHPIISIIIHFQWHRIRLFFYSYFALYTLFTAVYTAYAVLQEAPQISTNETKISDEVSLNFSNETTALYPDEKKYGGQNHATRGLLISSLTLLLGFSVLEFVKIIGCKYFSSLDNWGHPKTRTCGLVRTE